MSRYRRWNDLLELLAAEGQLQVERAAEMLGVSAATVRRDFDELAQQQMLRRIRGGAVAQGVTYDLPLRYKSERHPSEKQRIAAAAAHLVLSGQVVGLNGGTTTEVARVLAVRPDLVPSDWGRHHSGHQCAQHRRRAGGPSALQDRGNRRRGQAPVVRAHRPAGHRRTGAGDARRCHPRSGRHRPAGGATAHHEGEASTNRLMAARARRVVIAADSSKVGRRAFARICPAADIDVLVRFRGEPAISEFDWPFTPSHSSSPTFSTGVGSALQWVLPHLQPGHD